MESICLRFLPIRADAPLSKIPTVIEQRNLTLSPFGVAAKPPAFLRIAPMRLSRADAGEEHRRLRLVWPQRRLES